MRHTEAVKTARRAALFEGAAVDRRCSSAFMWVVEIVNKIDGQRLSSDGIYPRSLSGLPGIISAPFLHAGFGHLLGNTIPFVVLGLVIAVAGARRVIEVTAIVILVAGLGTWLAAGSGTRHRRRERRRLRLRRVSDRARLLHAQHRCAGDRRASWRCCSAPRSRRTSCRRPASPGRTTCSAALGGILAARVLARRPAKRRETVGAFREPLNDSDAEASRLRNPPPDRSRRGAPVSGWRGLTPRWPRSLRLVPRPVRNIRAGPAAVQDRPRRRSRILPKDLPRFEADPAGQSDRVAADAVSPVAEGARTLRRRACQLRARRRRGDQARRGRSDLRARGGEAALRRVASGRVARGRPRDRPLPARRGRRRQPRPRLLRACRGRAARLLRGHLQCAG